MSEVWNEGYFTDVGYTYGYYRETSPVFQRFCLLLRGLASGDQDDAAAHCELGFGQGVSININAAANPCLYAGTDFNPAHAAHARTLANHSGANLRLHDDSFEQLLCRNELPRFDSISLHGIWSWVSRENHRLLTKIAAKYLKPGGIFYVSYNCFPGWALAHPLRQILALHDRYAAGAASAAHRIDNALKFSGALLEAKPLFARDSPGLDARLKAIGGQNRDYLAHEYFNRDWHCMYFSDVVDALAEAKLEFATTADPLDVVDTVNLTTDGIAFLNNIEHPLLREQMRDYFVNQQFRKDLYLRGTRHLTEPEQREQALRIRLVLERPVAAIPMKISSPRGEATLHQQLFGPLLDELAARNYAPKSFDELSRALPGFSLQQMLMASAVLVGAGHASPCHPESVTKQVRATCAALNQHLLERARTREDIQHLASPVLGGGIAVGRIQQLFLLARSLGCEQPGEWARFAWQLFEVQGRSVLKGGEPLKSPEENIAELTLQAKLFLEERLPILRAMGVA